MQPMGMSVGSSYTSPRTQQLPHTGRNSVSLRSGFLGTPASCLQHKALCGSRIDSDLCRHGVSGSRRTTVMAAKGKPDRTLALSVDFWVVYMLHKRSDHASEGFCAPAPC
jgi:hypothetical protein